MKNHLRSHLTHTRLLCIYDHGWVNGYRARLVYKPYFAFSSMYEIASATVEIFSA